MLNPRVALIDELDRLAKALVETRYHATRADAQSALEELKRARELLSTASAGLQDTLMTEAAALIASARGRLLLT